MDLGVSELPVPAQSSYEEWLGENARLRAGLVPGLGEVEEWKAWLGMEVEVLLEAAEFGGGEQAGAEVVAGSGEAGSGSADRPEGVDSVPGGWPRSCVDSGAGGVLGVGGWSGECGRGREGTSAGVRSASGCAWSSPSTG